MNSLSLLQYITAICGIIGFIISPGITIIYPWLKERFSKKIKEKNKLILVKNITSLNKEELNVYVNELSSNFKLDWRPKVISAKLKAKKQLRSFNNGE